MDMYTTGTSDNTCINGDYVFSAYDTSANEAWYVYLLKSAFYN